LLDIIRVLNDLQEDRNTDTNVSIVLSVNSVVWTLIHEILF
jgi:hypothetical protein